MSTAWIQSLHLCLQHGSFLVSIESKGEFNFLKDKLENMNLTGEYFIGLRKLYGRWSWINNDNIDVVPGKPPWATYQPSGLGDCAKMYYSYVLKTFVYDNIECSLRIRNIGYICEKSLHCYSGKGIP